MATTTTMDALRRQHAADFALATRDHAFLKDVGAGTITPARFNTWLAQDYLFVRAFGRMLAATIARCPDIDLLTLIGGLAAIDAELNWFIAKAKERGIDLAATARQPTCVEYCKFLESLHSAPYAAQATALYAMEAAYHEAWAGVGAALAANGGTGAEYAEFADRWGNKPFGEYVVALARQADAALAKADAAAVAASADAFARVVALELDFWAMAYHAA